MMISHPQTQAAGDLNKIQIKHFEVKGSGGARGRLGGRNL